MGCWGVSRNTTSSGAEEAAGALQNVAASPDMACFLFSEQGPEPLRPWKTLLEAAACRPRAIQDFLASMMFNLAGTFQGRTGLVCFGGIEALLIFLRSGSCACAEAAASATLLLATREPGVLESLADFACKLVPALFCVQQSDLLGSEARRAGTSALRAILWHKRALMVLAGDDGILAALTGSLHSTEDRLGTELALQLLPPISASQQLKGMMIRNGLPRLLLELVRRDAFVNDACVALTALALDSTGQTAVLQAATDAVHSIIGCLEPRHESRGTNSCSGSGRCPDLGAAALLAQLASSPSGKSAILRENGPGALLRTMGIARRCGDEVLMRLVSCALLRLSSGQAGCAGIVAAGGVQALATLLCSDDSELGTEGAAVILSRVVACLGDPSTPVPLAAQVAARLVHFLKHGQHARVRVAAAGLAEALASSSEEAAAILVRNGICKALAAALQDEEAGDEACESGARALLALVRSHASLQGVDNPLPDEIPGTLCQMMLSANASLAASAGVCLEEMTRPHNPLSDYSCAKLLDGATLDLLGDVILNGCVTVRPLAITLVYSSLVAHLTRDFVCTRVLLKALGHSLSAAEPVQRRVAIQCLDLLVQHGQLSKVHAASDGRLEMLVSIAADQSADEALRFASIDILKCLAADSHVSHLLAEIQALRILVEGAAAACKTCPSLAVAMLEATAACAQQLPPQHVQQLQTSAAARALTTIFVVGRRRRRTAECTTTGEDMSLILLAQLVGSHSVVDGILDTPGGLMFIVQAAVIDGHGSSAELSNAASMVLHQAACHSKGREAIINHGGATTFVQSVRHGESSQQVMAASVLGKLATDTRLHSALLATVGGPGEIVSLLRIGIEGLSLGHDHAKDVTESMLNAVAHIACTAEEKAASFVAAGAMEISANLIQAPSTPSFLRISAAHTLAAFAGYTESMPNVRDPRVLRALHGMARDGSPDEVAASSMVLSLMVNTLLRDCSPSQGRREIARNRIMASPGLFQIVRGQVLTVSDVIRRLAPWMLRRTRQRSSHWQQLQLNDSPPERRRRASHLAVSSAWA